MKVQSPRNPIQERVALFRKILDSLSPFFTAESKVTLELTGKISQELELLRAIQNSDFYLDVSESVFFSNHLGLTPLDKFEHRLEHAGDTAATLTIVAEFLSQVECNTALLNLILKGKPARVLIQDSVDL